MERPRRPLGALGLAAWLAALASACAANGEGGEAASGGGDGVPGEVRFAIEVAAGDHPPILVQATSESRPVAWLRVLEDGRPLHVEERCAIPDCDDPDGAVCGASPPVVREIAPAGEAGGIEYLWAGARSVIDPGLACEVREPAPEGEYVARFCYGHTAEVDGDPAEARGALGRIAEPTCVERAFRLGQDADVVVRIP